MQILVQASGQGLWCLEGFPAAMRLGPELRENSAAELLVLYPMSNKTPKAYLLKSGSCISSPCDTRSVWREHNTFGLMVAYTVEALAQAADCAVRTSGRLSGAGREHQAVPGH